jgi:hypothetical protein
MSCSPVMVIGSAWVDDIGRSLLAVIVASRHHKGPT